MHSVGKQRGRIGVLVSCPTPGSRLYWNTFIRMLAAGREHLFISLLVYPPGSRSVRPPDTRSVCPTVAAARFFLRLAGCCVGGSCGRSGRDNVNTLKRTPYSECTCTRPHMLSACHRASYPLPGGFVCLFIHPAVCSSHSRPTGRLSALPRQ